MRKLLIAAAIACSFAMPGHAEFKAGDVVDVADVGFYIDSPEFPGNLECWRKDHSLDDLRKMIVVLRDSKNWTEASRLDCGRLDPSYAYEIMKVADGTPPYKQVYCVNSVYPYPSNKSGCVWAAFPRARLSACKASRALDPGEDIDIAMPQDVVDHFIKVEHHHMSCQGVAVAEPKPPAPTYHGDPKDDGAAVFLVYSEYCEALKPEAVVYAKMRLLEHPAAVQATVDHETRAVLAYKETWCELWRMWLPESVKR